MSLVACFNRLIAFDQLQNAELLIEVLERLRLRVEDLEAVLDGFGRVILADDQLLAADVADAFDLGRIVL